MKLGFKPEDFNGKGFVWNVDGPNMAKRLAEIANLRLQEMLSEMPIVYRHGLKHPGISDSWWERKGPRDTRQARLVEIEEP